MNGYSAVPNLVTRDSALPIGARLLFCILRSYAWADGFTDVTLERLSADLGKGGSVRNVKRWMVELEDAGLIRRERRRRPKGETWETTRTWLLVDVAKGQVIRREPESSQGAGPPEACGPSVARGGEPGAVQGPWREEGPGQSQGPSVAHNIDAISLRDCIDIDVDPSGAPRILGPQNADPEVRPPIYVAQANPPPVGDASTCSLACPVHLTGGTHAVNCHA